MIKAVFFDFYHTLVHYDPPREELEARALKDLGTEISPENLRRPLAMADDFIYQEHARLPIGKRSTEDRTALYKQYQEVVLKEAGIPASERLVLGLLGKMQQAKMKLVLFDDVLPVLAELKNRNLILGLISNVERDISPVCQELGLPPLLPIVVTSQDVGVGKPKPQIFQEALRRASVQAAEAMYVGDQYQVDVVGANQAGMRGVLLDRGGYFEQTNDSPRIRSLTQLTGLL